MSSNGRKASTPESIYYNPFAQESQRTTAVDVSYLAQSNHRPLARRRGSGSDSTTTSTDSSSSGLSIFTNTPRHTRWMTDGSTGAVASGGHHPLRSADLSSSGFRNGAGVTRPQLTRVLNIPPLVDAPPVPGEEMTVEPETAGGEKVVLVHEITPKDSLAGVSVKYGITMADLRRANHLWPSDPIHLRQVLYIPLENTSRARAPAPLLISTEDTGSPDPGNTNSPRSDKQPTSTILRIPASQMSFFPPPSKPQQPPAVEPRNHIPVHSKRPHSRHVRHASSNSPPPGTSPSLASILTALPIQPSTRDTIIARLSFDSAGTSSSYSDPEGHELDDVRRGSSLDSVFQPGELGIAFATPKARSKDVALAPPASPTRTHGRTTSASSAYVGGSAQYRRVGPMRTVQLEPSPVMQLPFATLSRRPQNGDVDLLGLGDGQGEGETVDLDL
ncbi:peptidoglycan-binding LysM domain protein [Mycena rebaudengoi]|nr:peptidoglycan-binding LysM domain protein [Mycena rebaudengoi]